MPIVVKKASLFRFGALRTLFAVTELRKTVTLLITQPMYFFFAQLDNRLGPFAQLANSDVK